MRSRRLFPSIGEQVFPSSSARSRAERIGVTPYKRCAQCGMPYDTRRTAWAKQGDGLGQPASVSVNGVVQANTKDRAVLSGCRFCGTHQASPTKIRALKDESLTYPSDDAKRRRRNR